jgi:hypothetical protein
MVTLSSLILHLSLLIVLDIPRTALGQSDDSYSYADYDYGDEGDYTPVDACAFYDNPSVHNEECHHEVFPSQTLTAMFNPNVKQCCGNKHAYMFYDNCEVNQGCVKT